MPNFEELPFKTPHLIQRMMKTSRPSQTGVDAHFRMDYMGRAEFEWGALPKSLKHMRANGPENFIIKEVKGSYLPDDAATSLWYVGREEEFQMGEAVIYNSLYSRGFFKEPTHIEKVLLPHDHSFVPHVEGWWALNPDHREPEFVPFAIFTKKEFAEVWKDSILD